MNFGGGKLVVSSGAGLGARPLTQPLRELVNLCTILNDGHKWGLMPMSRTLSGSSSAQLDSSAPVLQRFLTDENEGSQEGRKKRNAQMHAGEGPGGWLSWRSMGTMAQTRRGSNLSAFDPEEEGGRHHSAVI
eukprot:CAMPEP_0114173606 /NCGR_PEP_ID=MMETSP0043_2-20121206/35937_1 /TAXON_ID=464988 /ORGANISM="Hemiselmis andersenii, Strain CCMP644" /LENGTH=131 /DNA_ID=CAMNT_0001271637 /DNA_START=1 /DNA_END=393 /DNA_ORIENTATION=+